MKHCELSRFRFSGLGSHGGAVVDIFFKERKGWMALLLWGVLSSGPFSFCAVACSAMK